MDRLQEIILARQVDLNSRYTSWPNYGTRAKWEVMLAGEHWQECLEVSDPEASARVSLK